MITETVLEMHYHRPLMEAFRDTLGLGDAGTVNFYKYSPQKECFVGFDQAYAKSELSEDNFFDQLQAAALSSNYQLSPHFFGYFLQFKVVRAMKQRSRYTPSTIKSKPHYRVGLDTSVSLQTGVSQHELLYNLSKNSGAMVYYACPMLFSRTSLYDIDVDLETLRLAELDSCPSKYTDNDAHFIFFDDTTAQPVWCSDPVDGRASSPKDFIEKVVNERVRAERSAQSARELLDVLTDLGIAGVRADSPDIQRGTRRSILPLASEMLTVLRIVREPIAEI